MGLRTGDTVGPHFLPTQGVCSPHPSLISEGSPGLEGSLGVLLQLRPRSLATSGRWANGHLPVYHQGRGTER